MFDICGKTQSFSVINLEQLNASASFLDRIDRKFLLTQSQLEGLIPEFSKNFYVLEIGGKQVFSYENVYMDTHDYQFYRWHQEKRKSRVKVRTRCYIDSNLHFFEFKQKKKGVTRKFRYQIPSDEHGIMTAESKGFYKGVFASFYKEKAPKISPAIKTSYSRMTLVHKNSSERVTIDFNIQTSDLRADSVCETHLDNLVIVESKTMKDSSESLDIMDNHSIKRAKSCSKYSLGVVYSGLAEKFSTFEDTMQQIEKIRAELRG